ncbi:MAG: 2-phosphosulfolactate phosphatase [Chloroflexota bacterium]
MSDLDSRRHADTSPSRDRFVSTAVAGGLDGAVVVVDVLRAFTTAAYAFAAGTRHIYLVAGVEEALAFKAAMPGSLAMGEDRGRRPDDFDFSNSPTEVAAADLRDRIIVQRTGSGTQGVVAARSARRLWCASLVCASATAAAVRGADLGAPAYVITGWSATGPRGSGADDLATAELIERARLGSPLEAETTARFVETSDEAARTLALGAGHAHPEDIPRSVAVDAFDFAMEVIRTPLGLRLERVSPG